MPLIMPRPIMLGRLGGEADGRWGVHWDPPQSLEHLLQEAGRAGRDGLPAKSRIYLTERRRPRFKPRQGEEGSHAAAIPVSDSLLRYCRARRCRRAVLLEHFGERQVAPPPPRLRPASAPP